MFPTTQWSRLAEATLNGDLAGREALARLCEDYRPPVIAFLRTRGWNGHDAEDLAQEFFLKLLESKAWRRADRSRGRFRTFLLGALVHVIQHRREREAAAKRGSGSAPVSLDALAEEGCEPVAAAGDEFRFDRAWAQQVVAHAVAAIEAEFADRGAAGEFAVLRRYLPGAAAAPSYEESAMALGISLPNFKTAVHRLRQAFREKLRSSVARTVSTVGEIEEELRHLRRVLASSGSDASL
jgi:RNA polymerase sigma-70 factor (ECF subfamily)